MCVGVARWSMGGAKWSLGAARGLPVGYRAQNEGFRKFGKLGAGGATSTP